MQEADETRRLLVSYAAIRRLDCLHVLGLRTFRPLPFGERHSLSFLKLLKGYPLKILRVEKQILGLPCVNESKALVHQFLDRSFCHFMHVLKIVVAWRCLTQIVHAT